MGPQPRPPPKKKPVTRGEKGESKVEVVEDIR